MGCGASTPTKVSVAPGEDGNKASQLLKQLTTKGKSDAYYEASNGGEPIGVGSTAVVIIGVCIKAHRPPDSDERKGRVNSGVAKGDQVALKMIDRSKDIFSLERMYAEFSNNLRCCGHPHVVDAFELFESPTQFVIVAELVNGGDLITMLMEHFEQHDEFLSEEGVSALFKQMASAVAHVHSVGVIHRDIKPDNFMASRKRGRMRASSADFGSTHSIKLCDFGFAARYDPAGTEEAPKDLCGSLEYVSPEVLEPKLRMQKYSGGYNTEVDVWSLGIVLHVLLGGFCPFGADEEDETFEEQMRSVVDAHAETARRGLDLPDEQFGRRSGAVLSLLRSILKVDPTQRPSAKDLLAHPWLQGIEAMPKTQRSAFTARRGSIVERMTDFQDTTAKGRLKKAMKTVRAVTRMSLMLKNGGEVRTAESAWN